MVHSRSFGSHELLAQALLCRLPQAAGSAGSCTYITWDLHQVALQPPEEDAGSAQGGLTDLTADFAVCFVQSLHPLEVVVEPPTNEHSFPHCRLAGFALIMCMPGTSLQWMIPTVKTCLALYLQCMATHTISCSARHGISEIWQLQVLMQGVEKLGILGV